MDYVSASAHYVLLAFAVLPMTGLTRSVLGQLVLSDHMPGGTIAPRLSQ